MVRMLTARLSLCFGLVLILAGCASAHVDHVISVAAAPSQPQILLVEVRQDAALDEEAGEAVPLLEKAVLKDLAEAGLSARPMQPGEQAGAAAVLHVAVTRAESGSAWKRLLIGFGAGRAELGVSALLETPAAGQLTSFTTEGDSGRKPGLIMPIAGAAASRSVIPLAVGGGLKTVSSLNDGLDRTAGKTAEAIVGQLKRYYRQAGWNWPV